MAVLGTRQEGKAEVTGLDSGQYRAWCDHDRKRKKAKGMDVKLLQKALEGPGWLSSPLSHTTVF